MIEESEFIYINIEVKICTKIYLKNKVDQVAFVR